jgi:glycine cleavage system H lipoate-binding protein
MPVDGKVIQINDHFLEGNYELLLHNPENLGWVALIIPFQPDERNGLLLPKEYSMHAKSKYAKS